MTGCAKGIVEVRNEALGSICASRKVVAVLGSDEHAYYRLWMDRTVPAGDPRTDDPDGNGILGDSGASFSPFEGLGGGVWFITTGGLGAPYHAEEAALWNTHWKEKHADPDVLRRYYAWSPQGHVCVFDVRQERVVLHTYNAFGYCIDSVENLAKKIQRPG